jgi:diaminohydroxyphosphoribosylaminopyrimidine deaminase/5-amino-6-(5-phosphoribosylamino)uracil reductase
MYQIGKVSPNPLVGCIIVKDDKIIGHGCHLEFGKDHAEITAIKSAVTDIAGSTVYINLEPCSYYGKTPPCVNLLIEKKVARVVCGTIDPNPLVNGKSIRKLKKAGIETRVGVLANECRKLNEKFFKYIRTGIPFVTIKIAQTVDAKISSGRNDKNKISSLGSRRHVHRLRSEYDAILIGSNTLKKDNPDLTIRHVKGKQPLRVILNPEFDIEINSKVLTDEFADKTILIINKEQYKKKINKINLLIQSGIRIYPFGINKNGFFQLRSFLKFLGRLNISSILVEGGSKIFSSFIKEDLVDKIFIYISPRIFGKGIPSFDPAILDKNKVIYIRKNSIIRIGNDFLLEGKII